MTTSTGGFYTGGGDDGASKVPVVNMLPFSFDPTSSSQVLLGTLPKGARVTDVVGYGGATGGTNPTVDIGTSGDDDGFANELDCDAAASSAVTAGTAGALIWDKQTSPVAVYGKVGASAATGGTFVGVMLFIIDAGSDNP